MAKTTTVFLAFIFGYSINCFASRENNSDSSFPDTEKRFNKYRTTVKCIGKLAKRNPPDKALKLAESITLDLLSAFQEKRDELVPQLLGKCRTEVKNTHATRIQVGQNSEFEARSRWKEDIYTVLESFRKPEIFCRSIGIHLGIGLNIGGFMGPSSAYCKDAFGRAFIAIGGIAGQQGAIGAYIAIAAEEFPLYSSASLGPLGLAKVDTYVPIEASSEGGKFIGIGATGHFLGDDYVGFSYGLGLSVSSSKNVLGAFSLVKVKQSSADLLAMKLGFPLKTAATKENLFGWRQGDYFGKCFIPNG